MLLTVSPIVQRPIVSPDLSEHGGKIPNGLFKIRHDNGVAVGACLQHLTVRPRLHDFLCIDFHGFTRLISRHYFSGARYVTQLRHTGQSKLVVSLENTPDAGAKNGAQRSSLGARHSGHDTNPGWRLFGLALVGLSHPKRQIEDPSNDCECPKSKTSTRLGRRGPAQQGTERSKR